VINQPSSLQQPVDEQSNTTATQVPPASDVLPPPPAYKVATIDPEHPPWAQPPWFGALKAFLIWVASVVSLLFVPLILVIPYIVYRATTTPLQVVLAQLERDKTFLFLSVLGVIPAHVVTFLICYAVITGWRNYPIDKTLGLSWPSTWGPIKGAVICVLIAAALFGGGAVITWLFPGDKTQLDLLIESSNGARVVTAFLAIVTAPLVEEMVYRGILYPAISGVLGSAVAIGVVSLFFAAVHFPEYKNNLAVIGVITLVSITLTAVRAYTRRLLPCLVIHLVFNGIQAVIILLYPFLPRPEATPQPTPGELLPFVIRLFS
jgi:membrane protease YdiL (CAAX protease family)